MIRDIVGELLAAVEEHNALHGIPPTVRLRRALNAIEQERVRQLEEEERAGTTDGGRVSALSEIPARAGRDAPTPASWPTRDDIIAEFERVIAAAPGRVARREDIADAILALFPDHNSADLARCVAAAKKNAIWWRRELTAGRVKLEDVEWLIRDLEQAGGLR